MITCHKTHLVARCQQRGYTLAEVMPCVVSQSGDEWTIDVDHPAYPRTAREVDRTRSEVVPPQTGGPGTELKALLKDWLGITATANCSCNARARQMDEWGPDECERQMPVILTWLEEQAKGRKLPFVRIAAEQVVKLAIRRARKKAAQ